MSLCFYRVTDKLQDWTKWYILRRLPKMGPTDVWHFYEGDSWNLDIHWFSKFCLSRLMNFFWQVVLFCECGKKSPNLFRRVQSQTYIERGLVLVIFYNKLPWFLSELPEYISNVGVWCSLQTCGNKNIIVYTKCSSIL
jgi:hypothetical protein